MPSGRTITYVHKGARDPRAAQAGWRFVGHAPLAGPEAVIGAGGVSPIRIIPCDVRLTNPAASGEPRRWPGRLATFGVDGQTVAASPVPHQGPHCADDTELPMPSTGPTSWTG